MAVALAPGLSRKLKKVLETRTDSPDVVASLAALSDLYPDNNPHARRSLRSSIERRSLAINHDFLLASQPALQVLKPLPPLNLSVDHTFPKRFFFCCSNLGPHFSFRSDLQALDRVEEEVNALVECCDK